MKYGKLNINSLNYYEADGISIYMEPGLKIFKETIDIWLEQGLSYELVRIAGVRAPAS